MDIILAPDVFINASVALGSPPESVVKRVLGKDDVKAISSDWILGRIEQMFSAMPEFKDDAVTAQMDLIRGLVETVNADGAADFGADAWEEALVATAKKAGVDRVVTDHPDLLKMEESDGVEFMSTEAWMFEVMTPPPAPE